MMHLLGESIKKDTLVKKILKDAFVKKKYQTTHLLRKNIKRHICSEKILTDSFVRKKY